MNDVVTLLLGGGLAATVIEAVKFLATRQQVKRKDEAASQSEEAAAEATIGGAWKDLWQTGDQWSKKLDEMLRHERQRGEQYVDLIQEACELLPPEQSGPILDQMHSIRRS